MNDMESMRMFADQLWKYMVPKLDSKFASNVSYFRAKVVSNLGNNMLEVERPVESGALTLPCVRAMSGAQAGQQVVALVMGSMSNAVVVADGKMNVPGGGGDAGISNFQARPDGSLVITLTDGTTFTAMPHDPTKQDMLTFDAAPTQGSNNPVKSGGIYTALQGKQDTLTFDDTPTANSSNPVKSGGVYTALDGKVDKVAGKGLSTNDFTTAEKNKLAGIEAGAEVNQNAFSNVAVGSVTVSADSKTDTLTLVAGDNVTLTPNATNDSVTIAATDTTYSSKAAASGGTAVSLVTTGEKYNWNHKQDALTFDDVPTAGSNNPVKSSGIYSALEQKANTGHTHDNLYYKLTNGTAIPSAEDLNDATYRTPGNYICSNTKTAKTIKHTPGYDATTLVNSNISAFKLWVGYANGGSGYISQELRTFNDGAVYYRYFHTSSWSAWQAVRGNASILIGELNTTSATLDVTDNTLIATSASSGETGTWYRRPATKLWNYIKSKADAVYAAISHAHDASDITSGILPAARGGTGNGEGYIQIGQKSGTTLGMKATAEGLNVTASGTECHAEGAWTVASGSCSHAEGLESESSGNNSHAEGYKTVASGSFSHAEGNYTTASNSSCHSEGEGTLASGDCSHAEGAYTIADGWTQHVFGRYNVSDITNVEIVGWGTSSTRKNIRTLGRTGNEWIAGTLTQASDARLKDVQGEIPNLSSVRAVRFRWRSGDDRDHIGYLAQDVEGIAPYLVGMDSNGYKSLDYIALLTAKVEMLEREIKRLKGEP